MVGMAPTLDQLRRVPKVLLHDHLDGGLRPATIVELAERSGYQGLPTTDPAELGVLIRSAAASHGNLEAYLQTFRHTVGVMQTCDALVRVAAECAEDLAADGVVYAEVRFAPELHVTAGLSLDQVVEAVLEGFAAGSAGRGIRVYALLTAMRTAARSLEIAELAVRYRDIGVVGFDIAGAEAGSPPSRHLDAFQYVARENFHITIHAGEGFGLKSIWEAVQWCGAERLGHGVRIIDDIVGEPDGRAPLCPPGSHRRGPGGPPGCGAERLGHGVRIIDDIVVEPDGSARLGLLASYVRDRRISLEMCPTSNVHPGAAASISEHPIGLLRRLSFRVTVNTDNRLMSGVTLSSEFAALGEAFGYGWSDIQWLTINAMKSAFAPFDERLGLINTVIKPGFAAAMAPSVTSRAAAPGAQGYAGRPGAAGTRT